MDYQHISNTLEFLREQEIELKNSKEYRLGLKVYRLINDIKHLKLLNFIKRELNFRKIAKYNFKWEIPLDNFKYGDYPCESVKFVVYTCITGDYDNIQEPLYTHSSIDYVLFTDNTNIKSSVWEIRYIPDDIMKLGNNVLINRYFKFNPSMLFSGYNYSLYIDGNIRVISDIRNMINRMNSKTGLAMHRHNSRNCIYKEAEVCKIEKKGNYKIITDQLEKYKKEGFPENFGLYEANIILSDLNSTSAERILTNWWREFTATSSFRDQIALPYVVWKCGFGFDDIGNLGINMHNNPKFEKVSHL